jgi:multimeric flavodoxin WrbA
MKVLAINGSPRKNGNTAAMLDEVLAGAAEKGAETRIIHLNDLNMKGCQGCLWCRDNLGECAYQDDFQDVLKEMKECDAVALGSPIYVFQVTGQFKCFLDRCYCFTEIDEEAGTYATVLPEGKKIAFVSSQGDENPETYQHVIEYVKMLFSFLSGAGVEIITQVGTEDKGDAAKDADLMVKARGVGHTLAS